MPRPRPSLRIPGPAREKSAPAARRDRSLIPAGMSTILPESAQRVRLLEDVLLKTLARWGYQEIIPPAFEYLDVLAPGLEQGLVEACYKFADRATGRILLLRPDVTAQIARIVGTGMMEARLPLRLSYRTTVFRHEPEHAGRDREIFQVGAELIGVDDAAMDGESVALMADCLWRLGLSEFTVSLGHGGFFKALVARAGLSQEGRKLAEQAAAKKDLPRLEAILSRERVAAKAAKGILEAPRLYGRDEVLKRGRELAGRDVQARTALDRLAQVYRLLTEAGLKDRLVLDLGEFRGFDYYDGLVCDVFAEGVGCELGGGGRYNSLIGRFGRDLPSTGFAFDVDRLFQALERRGHGAPRQSGPVLLSAPTHQVRRLFQLSGLLRTAGIAVVHGALRPNSPRRLQAVAEEGRRLGASSAALIGLAGQPADEVLVLAGLAGTRPLRRQRMALKELVGHLSRNHR